MSTTDPQAPLFNEFPAVDTAEWRKAVQSDLRGANPDDFLAWSSIDGISIPAYLHPEDLDDLLHVTSDTDAPPLADATERPANAWKICQSIHHPDLNTANEHARAALDGGVSDLQLNGILDSEANSLQVTSSDDLSALLKGIDLEETGLHLGDGLSAPVLYAALREYLAGRGVDPDALRGSVRYDPVAAVATGQLGGVDRAFSLAHDLLHDATTLPLFQLASIDSRAYHDAGASAVQELACALGTLTERLARGTEQGISLSTMLDNLQFSVSVSTSYFVEIAKLRALRLLATQVVEAFANEGRTEIDFAPSHPRIHAETSRRTETIYDPYVNMLRATTEAMAAVLGGCDLLTVRPYDAALRVPDDFGLRIARNTQHILRHEAHLDQVADPAAGSYYVEALTDQLARRAWEQFQEIEAEGGIVEALRKGTLQQQIAETRQERREAIDERAHVLVGTTHYPALGEQRRDDLTHPNDSSSSGTSRSLEEPSIDAIREALHEGATLSDITSDLTEDSPDTAPLPQIRVAEAIESIRLRTERYAESHADPPKVLLAPLGAPAARSARATFARNFLGVAGFAIEEPLKFESVDEAADAAVEQQADAVVLCSANEEYPTLASALPSALAARNHDALLGIAGSPNEIEAGDIADFFVHQDSPLIETLTTLQDRLGIPTENTN